MQSTLTFAGVAPARVHHPTAALGRVATIARFTLQEAVSRRLILAGIVLSLAFLALYAVGFSFLHGFIVGGAGPRSVRGGPQGVAIVSAILTLLGLYCVNFLASFLALFLSVGAVSGEIDSGTLHALLAHPIRRAEFILGRWLAYCGMMAAYVAAMAGALLLVTFLISGFQAPDTARAVGLMVLGAVVLLSLSLWGSTVLSTLANGVVVFTLFGAAWLAGFIEFIGGLLDNQAMVNLGTAVSLVIPSDAVWRGASYYVQPPALLAATAAGPGAVPFFANTPPTGAMVTWALLYPLVFLALAILSFRRRDL